MTANTGKLTVMAEGKEMLELILSTESRVLSTNIKDFEQRAEQFLSGLTQKFETDDDFVAAKEEVKTLKEVEEKIRAAIKTATSGEVASLIETAEAIAERFRTERLNREKLVKAKEAEIKANVVNAAFAEISKVRYSYVSDISLAIEKTYPKTKLQDRLNEAAKRRSTLATLTKAVNAEATAIIAELGQESARLIARKKLLPAEYEHLFKDWLELIAGDADLEPIVAERVQAEKQRQAQASTAQVEPEKTTQQAVEKPQETAKETAENVVLADFVITIRLNQTTQQQAVEIARKLKAELGDVVSLNKAK